MTKPLVEPFNYNVSYSFFHDFANDNMTNVTRYGKTDHSRKTLNLRYVSSKFNSQYVNFDRVRYF